MDNKIHISDGNTKLGKIPNISLPPITTCKAGIPCAKHCYAVNTVTQYAHVRRNWQQNLDVYLSDPNSYFRQVRQYLHTHKSQYFRWHVGGDCPDAQYVGYIKDVAIDMSEVKFMLFTKKPELFRNLPGNLNVLYSMWPYVHNNMDINMARSWIRSDWRKPDDGFICKGQCIDCLRCWMVRFFPTDIIIKFH